MLAPVQFARRLVNSMIGQLNFAASGKVEQLLPIVDLWLWYPVAKITYFCRVTVVPHKAHRTCGEARQAWLWRRSAFEAYHPIVLKTSSRPFHYPDTCHRGIEHRDCATRSSVLYSGWYARYFFLGPTSEIRNSCIHHLLCFATKAEEQKIVGIARLLCPGRREHAVSVWFESYRQHWSFSFFIPLLNPHLPLTARAQPKTWREKHKESHHPQCSVHYTISAGICQ